jgi:membrane protein DedA with SNARE-associated domain
VLASLTSQFTSIVGSHGLYAVFGLMLVDALLPAASEAVMVYAGAVAAGAFAGQDVVLVGAKIPHGLPAYAAMALAGTVGYLAGSLAGWGIGAAGGRPLLERHGAWFHLDAEKLARAEAWFDRWGDWAVLLGRVTPVVRSFISIPAGVFRAPLHRYLWLTLVGSAVWSFALAGVGWGLGESWQTFHDRFRYADYAAAGALAAGIILLAWKLRGRRRGGKDAARG